MKLALIIAFAGLLAFSNNGIAREASGVLKGRLFIASPNEVNLEGDHAGKTSAPDYGKFPLLVRDRAGKIVAQMQANRDGSFEISLPAGKYILAADKQQHRHLRAKPVPFTIAARETTRLDFYIDTGVR